MNEGENSSMPQNPNFSSPNISSSNNPAPTEPVAPTPQTVTSADISAMAGTDAGAVAAAAAAMPENDAQSAISSGVISSQSSIATQPSRSRFGFSNRKFNAAQQQARPAFAGAPDYFNQAANNTIEPKKSKRKIYIIGAIILVISVLLVLIVVLLAPSLSETAASRDGKKVLEKINEEQFISLVDLEKTFDELSNGAEADNADIYDYLTNKTYSEYRKKVENVEKLSNELKSLDDSSIADIYKEKLVNAQEKVAHAAKNYREMFDIYASEFKVIKGEVSSNDDEATANIAHYYLQYNNAKRQIKAKKCMSMADFDSVCRALVDKRKEADEYLKKISAIDLFGGKEKYDKNNRAVDAVNELYYLIPENIREE